MLWIKLRPIVAVLAVGLAATGVGRHLTSAQEPAPPPQAAPLRPGGASPPPAAASRPRAEAADAQIQLRAQEIATHRARIEADQARLARELAELALEEHREVDSPRSSTNQEQKVAGARVDYQLARVDLKIAQSRRPDRPDAQQDLASAQATAEIAQLKFAAAEADQVAHARSLAEREAQHLLPQIDKARTEEKAAQVRWEAERVKEDALRTRISVSFPGRTFEFYRGAFW